MSNFKLMLDILTNQLRNHGTTKQGTYNKQDPTHFENHKGIFYTPWFSVFIEPNLSSEDEDANLGLKPEWLKRDCSFGVVEEREGCYAVEVVFDGNREGECEKISEYPYNLDGSDQEKVLEEAKKHASLLQTRHEEPYPYPADPGGFFPTPALIQVEVSDCTWSTEIKFTRILEGKEKELLATAIWGDGVFEGVRNSEVELKVEELTKLCLTSGVIVKEEEIEKILLSINSDNNGPEEHSLSYYE